MSKEVENKTTNMAYGVIDEIPSMKVYDYEAVCGAGSSETTFPSYFRLNIEEMGYSVKSQGLIGACVACATSTALEALILREVLGKTNGEEITSEDLNKELLGVEEISHWFTYGYCRDDNSTGYGMIPTSCLDHLRKKGTVPMKYFDIADEMPSIKKKVKEFPELASIAEKYKLGGYVKFSMKKDEKDNQIKEALMKYRTPLVCVSPRGFGSVSHCICLVGWDDEKDTYILKNSWGELNGDKGLLNLDKGKITDVYLPLNKEITLPFTDVDKDDWFYSGVRSANLSGIMTGRTQTEFAPLENITRAEVATIVSRILEKIDERFENLNKILEKKGVFDK